MDNARKLKIREDEYTHLVYNKNTGGSGGFQRGIEEIRKQKGFTHVIFMDDDVVFDINSFYLLFDFLTQVDEENRDRPVAPYVLYGQTKYSIYSGGEVEWWKYFTCGIFA